MKINKIFIISTLILSTLGSTTTTATTSENIDATTPSSENLLPSPSPSDPSTPEPSSPSATKQNEATEETTPKEEQPTSPVTTTAATPTTDSQNEVTSFEEGNHPMGFYTDAQTSETPMPTVKQALQRYMGASSPSNLTSTDKTLPRKDAVDIASYQSWMTQSDFNNMKKQGVKTIIIKLTEGTYYKNSYAASHIKMAHNAGLNIATYHFSIFGSTSNQTTANNAATAEANYYAAEAKRLGLPTTTVMINDAEYSGTAAKVWTQASQKFTQKLKALGYSTVRQYTSKTWAENGTMKPATFGPKNMWIAQYLYGKPSASNLQNTQYGAWQYTSQMYFTDASNHKPVDTSIDYNNLFKPSNPVAPSGYKNIYRLYNSRNKEHLYTADAYEKDRLPQISRDWHYEGVAWYAPKSSNTPIYRVYNPRSGEHLYTKDSYEIKVLTTKHGWKKEGTAFYSESNSGKPAYRLFNPAAGVGAHFVTMDAHEKQVLTTKHGWKYEGIAWYGKK